MGQKIVNIRSNIKLSNDLPIVIFGGLNVIESRDLSLKVCEKYVSITQKLNIPYVFKASFDKANRSSVHSFRGVGLNEGLKILEEIKNTFNIPIMTDIHEPYQAKVVSEVCDIIQLPAFLSRQTDLVIAIAETGKGINIKKAQFLSPNEIKNIIIKCEHIGNYNIMICERGSCFGYNNLVVDMLGFGVMKKFEYPILFDVNHSLQLPGGMINSSGGRGDQLIDLALAGVSQKIAGLFIESHPNPSQSKCDGQSSLKLNNLYQLLCQIQKLDQLVKSFTKI